MTPLGLTKYDGETLWLELPIIKNPWNYTVKELRWINQIRNALIADGHDSDIICKDVEEFIEDGWFYNRNPRYRHVL